MAKEKKVSIGALNITMHPHSPQHYVQLFKDAKIMKCFARLSKDKAGLIATANYLDKSKGKTSALTGDLYRFNDIDLQGNWFNTQTGQHAEEEDLERVSIPEHLKPNSSRFQYLFFPESHVLFYESYYDGHTLGHRNAKKLVEGALNDPRLVEKYGNIDVTIIPSREELSKAMEIPRMDRLTMLIKRPNPDNHKKAERKVLERLNAQNVSEYQSELTSIPGSSIEPDPETKALSEIAARNGTVQVKGRDSKGHPVQYNTVDHPWSHSEYYDPEVETAYNTFENTVIHVREDVEHWINREDE